MPNKDDLSQQIGVSRINSVTEALLLTQTSLTPLTVTQSPVLLAINWLQCKIPVWGIIYFFFLNTFLCFTVWFVMIFSWNFLLIPPSTASCLSGRPTMHCSWFAACSRCSSGRWVRKSCTNSSPTRRGHQAPAEVSTVCWLAGKWMCVVG